ncbi:MAG: T9SS type A sorting domain-containing protein [Bacteroidota bacterium]|nr:T9SS type A sorting domain-containing protein [Bacteroidota bacterium]
MYKKLLFTLCLGFVSANAQISISSSHMPSIGDTIRYSEASAGSFDFKQTGTNYSWNFTALGINRQDIYQYKSLINTPYAQQIISGLPFGAIGYKVADSIGGGGFSFKDIYNFYEKTSNVWRAVGTGLTIPLGTTTLKTGGVHSDKDEIYAFPLNYNDSDFSTFKVTTPLGISFLNVGSFMQQGTRSNKVEGWGTISTPYASNISCIKVRSVIEEIDSLKVSIPGQTPISVGFPLNRVEYKWLSQTEKIPMLEVIGTEIAGIFTPTSIRYRDNYRVPTPSPFGPRANFTVDKTKGKTLIDSFKFTNTTFPNFGNTYEWTITPSAGVKYVKNTSRTSANPQVVFNNVGKYTVTLKATNIAGYRDTTFTDMIDITASTSLNHVIKNDETLFYPNPSQNNIQFYDINLINSNYQILTMDGKVIQNGIIASDLSIQLSDLNTGNYIIIIKNNQVLIPSIIHKY